VEAADSTGVEKILFSGVWKVLILWELQTGVLTGKMSLKWRRKEGREEIVEEEVMAGTQVPFFSAS
jgi:hypothetical protein